MVIFWFFIKLNANHLDFFVGVFLVTFFTATFLDGVLAFDAVVDFLTEETDFAFAVFWTLVFGVDFFTSVFLVVFAILFIFSFFVLFDY